MSIIPCGKSNLFKSDLNTFKNRYASKYVKEALDSIDELDVEAKCSHGHEASTYSGDCDEVIVIKKKENPMKPMREKVKEGDDFDKSNKPGKSSWQEILDEEEDYERGDDVKPFHNPKHKSHASIDPRYISIAELKQSLAKMDKLDKDKLTSYWTDILGEEWTKALVKEYF